MVGWHQQLSRHEFEQTPDGSEGQEVLVCYSPWGCRQLDMTVTETTAILYWKQHNWGEISKYMSKCNFQKHLNSQKQKDTNYLSKLQPRKLA